MTKRPVRDRCGGMQDVQADLTLRGKTAKLVLVERKTRYMGVGKVHL